MERGSESNMMGILNKIQRHEAQKHLLETTLKEQRLLQSKILSKVERNSIMKTWKIGRKKN